MEFGITEAIPDDIEIGKRCRGGNLFKTEQRPIESAGGFITARWTRQAYMLHSWPFHGKSPDHRWNSGCQAMAGIQCGAFSS
jgi:hypothetical protein